MFERISLDFPDAEPDDILTAYYRVCLKLDHVDFLLSFSYFFTTSSLEDLADRYYRTDPKTGKLVKVTKQMIHQRVVVRTIEMIREEMELMAKERKVARMKMDPQDNRILFAFDAASHTSGYTVFHNEKIVEIGAIQCPPKLHLPKRIAYQHKEILALIKKYMSKYGTRGAHYFIAVEDFFFFGKKANAARYILPMKGAIFATLSAYPCMIVLDEVNQSSWKADYKKITEDKADIDETVLKFLVKNLGQEEAALRKLPMDAVEAAAIGIYSIVHDKTYKEFCHAE